MAFIEQVNSPDDLKRLSIKDLSLYADEIRQYIVDVVKNRGGHLSSNLGSIELTLALHYVFSAPQDKIIFDVGHQSYAHKIITGRKEAFQNLRCDDGISGFPNATESEYDVFTTGHSSNSLSLGVGLCRARTLNNGDHNVVAVIGDGAFTGGMAFEALNDIGANKEKLIIVLNDNKMSISKNVGAFSNYLAKLRLSKRYSSFKYKLKRGVSALPFFGSEIVGLLDKIKDSVKISLLPNKIFENLGVKYYGPLNGHDIPRLVDSLTRLKSAKGPVILHVVTNKGNGVEEIMKAPDKFHGVSPQNCESEISYSSVISEKLCEMASRDDKVVAVTAAMAAGTGLEKFSQEYPNRYYDVGIAEQHATSMCAGFTVGGIKPYFAVYSSFLQRAYDQIMQDVCIDNRAVTFLVDHAGVVGGDGVTHQGLYDGAFLSSFPNMTVLQPKDGNELKEMLDFSLNYGAPLAIRYAKSYKKELPKVKSFNDLSWEMLRYDEKNEVTVLAVGNYANLLALDLNKVNVVNARTIKPLDEQMLEVISGSKLVVTIEEGVEKGGFGEAVRAYYACKEKAPKVLVCAHPNVFISSVSRDKILADAGLTLEKVENRIKNTLKSIE